MWNIDVKVWFCFTIWFWGEIAKFKSSERTAFFEYRRQTFNYNLETPHNYRMTDDDISIQGLHSGLNSGIVIIPEIAVTACFMR